MKKLIVLCNAALLLLLVAACDDNTGTLGSSVIPDTDIISVDTATYHATSRSVLAGSLPAKASTVWFGRFTDPDTGTMLESDFITQFNCVEGGNVFPPADSIRGDSAVAIEVRLYYTTFLGDSLNAMQLEVYNLQETLQEGVTYYTDTDLDRYVLPGSKPIATKNWSAIDMTLSKDVLEDSEHYHNVSIPLPTSMGTDIIKAYRTHPEYFANATSFIENVCKGLRIKCTQGDGTLLCVEQINLNVTFAMARTDSTYTTQFTGSREVLQVGSFHSSNLQPLLDDSSCTWLKTPAGIFTEVTLPVEEITANEKDTINSAQITFRKYNTRYKSNTFALDAPRTLLLIRKGEVDEFFRNGKVSDNVSTCYSKFDSTFNLYTFNNIARIITTCRNERDHWCQNWLKDNAGKSQSDAHAAFVQAFPDWDKVLLVPVATTTDNSGNIATMRHELGLSSAQLAGGDTPIDISIITTAFR